MAAELVILNPTLSCSACGMAIDFTWINRKEGTVSLHYPCDSCKHERAVLTLPMLKPEQQSSIDESWLQPGGVVPVDPVTTGLLVDEVRRLRHDIERAMKNHNADLNPCQHNRINGSVSSDGKSEMYCADCGQTL